MIPVRAASSACDGCLRRAYLLGHLAPRIGALIDGPGYRAPGLLALAEHDLIAAAAGARADEARRFVERFDAPSARRELGDAGIGAVCRHADGYPEALTALDDPPAALFHTQSAERLRRAANEPAVALVGSRRGSSYGLEVARALGRGLGAAGITVVSGLALGIDAAAHRGCLDGGGTAVAVLPGGPDAPYPRRHRALYERVRDQGVVVSELPPGARAYRWSFPARNRIMAGLARMTVVVEAADPSGSLITAEFAQQLGRAVAAVPGRITSRVAAGSNALLRDGAQPITGPEDVLDELFGVGAAEARRRAARAGRPRAASPAHDSLLGRVLDAVEDGKGVDAIARDTGLPAGEVRAALVRLESGGHLVRSGLGSYERAVAR